MAKVIQEQFGDAIIEAVAMFARSDLTAVDQLKRNDFSHVGDNGLRDVLAETFYGARWIYKLGLALLVKDAEQMAHVRAQVMDYGSVCEGLLSDCLSHAIQEQQMRGQKYKYADPINLRRTINWSVQDILAQVSRQSFFWRIEVASEEGIIDQRLKDRLHWTRKERNTVHKTAKTHKAFLGTSKSLFDTVLETLRQTKDWRAKHS